MYIHNLRAQRGAEIKADESKTQGHHLLIHDCVIEARFLFTVAAQRRGVIFFNSCNNTLHVAMSPLVELVKTQSHLIIYFVFTFEERSGFETFQSHISAALKDPSKPSKMNKDELMWWTAGAPDALR